MNQIYSIFKVAAGVYKIVPLLVVLSYNVTYTVHLLSEKIHLQNVLLKSNHHFLKVKLVKFPISLTAKGKSTGHSFLEKCLDAIYQSSVISKSAVLT